MKELKMTPNQKAKQDMELGDTGAASGKESA